MKRFYKTAAVTQEPGGHGVALDGRAVKTPMKVPLIMPTYALADAVAQEWMAQEDTIDPQAMHLTRLANTALDRVQTRRDMIIDEIVGYAGTDLLCYRAENPDALVAKQAKAWDPYLDWLHDRYGVKFVTTSGILHVPQAEPSLAAMQNVIAAQDSYRLSGLHALTTGFGSVTLGLACLMKFSDFDTCWTVSRLDEDYQRDQWGADAEADKNAEILRQELSIAAMYLTLLEE